MSRAGGWNGRYLRLDPMQQAIIREVLQVWNLAWRYRSENNFRLLHVCRDELYTMGRAFRCCGQEWAAEWCFRLSLALMLERRV